MSPISNEFEYLQKLIRDFPPANPIDPKSALKLLRERYVSALEVWLSLALSEVEDIEFPILFLGISLLTHRDMYEGILSNVGKIRSIHDPGIGRVIFGGPDFRTPSGGKLEGVNPRKIMGELPFAFGHLSRDSSTPVRDAMSFYQKFVRVHPFYDANGRIARLIVSVYLDYHGYFVNWGGLKKKDNKFCNKLNKCHVRDFRNPHSKYEKYFRYLLNFFKKYVQSKEILKES